MSGQEFRVSSSEPLGWLVTITDPVRMFELSPPFKVGRDPSTCSLIIDEDLYKKNEKNFENNKRLWIFRRHFIVEKKIGVKSAVLIDLSTKSKEGIQEGCRKS